jgi:hypothetical protein
MKRIEILTIGSTGSCLMGSEASAMDVSVSAPLAREDRGAMPSDLQPPLRCIVWVDSPFAAYGDVTVARECFVIAFVMELP